MRSANNFDGLRLAAAMAVLLSHMAALSGRGEWLVYGTTWGTIGVLVFFAISGYLVLASWRSDPNIGRFLERRFLRIAPGLIVATVTTFFLVRLLGLAGFPENRFNQLNGSLWTIEYEVYCYLLIPAFAAWLGRPALVAAVAMISFIVVVPSPLDNSTAHWLQFFGTSFVLGMMLNEYPRLQRWSWAIVALGIAALPLDRIALCLVIAPITIFIGTRSWPLLRDAGRHGDLSYGTYIYAWPIQQIVVSHMPGAAYWLMLAVTIPIVGVLSWSSWTFVESPAMRKKPANPKQIQPPAHELSSALSRAQP